MTQKIDLTKYDLSGPIPADETQRQYISWQKQRDMWISWLLSWAENLLAA